MNTKLTLSLDSIVIDEAKMHLQTKSKSLSGLIEDYFKLLILTKNKRIAATPLVRELTGIARLNKNRNDESIMTDYLLEKYT